MRRGPYVAAAVAAAAIGAVVVAGAVSGGDSGPSTSADTTTTSFDRADEFTPDHSRFKFGQESLIVDGAVEPRQLEANIEEAVAITNTTDEPVQVTFVNGGVGLDQATTELVLDAGESFSFEESYAHSIYFEVNGDENWAGTIRVDYMRFGEEG